MEDKDKDKIVEDKGSFLLYGINDFLYGNENKINLCFPVLKADDSYFVARNANWDIKSGQGVLKINNQKVIDNKITEIQSKEDIFMVSKQMPALIGPIFAQGFNDLYLEKDRTFIGKTYPIQNNFLIVPMDVDSYKSICSKMRDDSKEIFDKELNKSKGKFINKVAESALVLLIGNASTSPKDYYLRVLAEYKVKEDMNMYDEFLGFAALDLKMLEKDVEKLCGNYLEEILH
jgi:hypothetical protein